MKNLVKIIYISITCLILTACNACGEKVTVTKTYPDQNRAIVWVSKDCGATTVPTATAYIIPLKSLERVESEKPKIHRKYKILAATRGKIEFNWISNENLEVIYDFPVLYERQGEFYSQATSVDGVNIVYRQK